MGRRTVWKFELQPRITLLMPAGAQALHVHEQNGGVCLWALVDPEAPKEARTFLTFGTGHEGVPEDARYVGSAHLSGGVLVFHVFEVGRVMDA